mmetsp:Transcript_42644/g.99390  ORF Transcript_42644/g.99390 Transcript_42644/m.99390 type:complete len:217 (-) Transcript_42644:81-731(-)
MGSAPMPCMPIIPIGIMPMGPIPPIPAMPPYMPMGFIWPMPYGLKAPWPPFPPPPPNLPRPPLPTPFWPLPPDTLQACIWPGFSRFSSTSKRTTSPCWGMLPSTTDLMCMKRSEPSESVIKPKPLSSRKFLTVPWLAPGFPLPLPPPGCPVPPLTLMACICPGFTLLSSMSNWTMSSFTRMLPSMIALTCTKISLESGLMMKPKPLSSRKDFTVPW